MTIDTARRTRRPNVLRPRGASVVKYFMFNSGCLSARSGANRRVLLRNTRVMVGPALAPSLHTHETPTSAAEDPALAHNLPTPFPALRDLTLVRVRRR